MTNYEDLANQFSEMPPAAQAVTGVVTFIIVILAIVAEWKIFTKAGEKGWYSLIPILREYELCKIIDGKGIKFLLLIVPIVNAIYAIILDFRLAKVFGKGTGFGFGLLFFPSIFTLILGFGDAQYVGPHSK